MHVLHRAVSFLQRQSNCYYVKRMHSGCATIRLLCTLKQEKKGTDPFAIPEMIQREVAWRFGLREEIAIEAMRCAETLPQMSPADVAEVREISHYRKYNRCQDGILQVGDTIPLNIDLWKLPVLSQGKFATDALDSRYDSCCCE